jgi:hypothetical protein
MSKLEANIKIHGKKMVGIALSFDGSKSIDAEGQGGSIMLNYLWDFGDGKKSKSTIANHIFDKEGIYKISLTIRDIIAGINKSVFDEIEILPREEV